MRKLHPKFCRPFKITERINEVTFTLAFSEPMKARGKHDLFHGSFFKPFVPDQYGRYDQPLPPVNIQDGIEDYEFEAILDSKKIRKKQHFIVKWKGYDNHENTLQTKENLKNAQEALQAYETSRRRPSWPRRSCNAQFPIPRYLSFFSIFFFSLSLRNTPFTFLVYLRFSPCFTTPLP